MDDYLTEKKITELNQMADEYAHAKSIRVYLEHFRHSKIALLMKDAEVAGYKTAALQDREARADPEYGTILMGLKDAVQKEEALKWKLETERNLFEQWRSRAATERAEIQMR